VLEQATEAFLSTYPTTQRSSLKAAIITRAGYLAENIERTYRGELFQEMPHLAVIPVFRWLRQAYTKLGKSNVASKHAAALLRSHGYKLDTHGQQVKIGCTNAILNTNVVDALVYISQAYSQRESSLSGKYNELAREVYVTINGGITEFEARYMDGSLAQLR
jgi:hypothetical protein